MCYGSIQAQQSKQVAVAQQAKGKPRMVPIDQIKGLTERAGLIVQELEACKGRYPGISSVIVARQTLGELKGGENTKDLPITKRLEGAVEPHLIEANTASYW